MAQKWMDFFGGAHKPPIFPLENGPCPKKETIEKTSIRLTRCETLSFNGGKYPPQSIFGVEIAPDFGGHHLKSGVCEGVYEFLILSHFCLMTTTTTTQTT